MKKLGIGVIALLVVGLATATYYLSNSVTANVHVDKPMSMRASYENGTWANPLELGDMFGGGTANFNVETTAHSAVPIDKSSQIYKIANAGVNCDYFDVFTVAGVDVMPLCVNQTDYVEVALPSQVWTEGQVDLDAVVLTFALFAEGDYVISVDVRYNE